MPWQVDVNRSIGKLKLDKKGVEGGDFFELCTTDTCRIAVTVCLNREFRIYLNQRAAHSAQTSNFENFKLQLVAKVNNFERLGAFVWLLLNLIITWFSLRDGSDL